MSEWQWTQSHSCSGAKKGWLSAHPTIHLLSGLVRQHHGRGNRKNVKVGRKEKGLQNTVFEVWHSHCKHVLTPAVAACTALVWEEVNHTPGKDSWTLQSLLNYWQILEVPVFRSLPNCDSSKSMVPQTPLLKSVRPTPPDQAPLKAAANRDVKDFARDKLLCMQKPCMQR